MSKVSPGCIHARIHSRYWKQFSCGEIMFDLIKYPWIANTGSADHDTIHTITLLVFLSFLWRIDITISKNRNPHAGIILYLAYQRPVSFTFVHLRPCPGMNRKGFYSDIL